MTKINLSNNRAYIFVEKIIAQWSQQENSSGNVRNDN